MIGLAASTGSPHGSTSMLVGLLGPEEPHAPDLHGHRPSEPPGGSHQRLRIGGASRIESRWSVTALAPRVSVLLPVYDGAACVERAIRSIQTQTFTDWELVICDDGSHDGSFQICRALSEGDERILLLRNPENRGLAATMNRLVREAKGELCAIQEQDDESVPERLRLEVEAMDRHPDAGVSSGVAAWRNRAGEVWAHFPWFLKMGGGYPTDRDELIRFLYVDQSKIVNAAAMIRRSLFTNHGLRYDEQARMAIDWQFFVDAAHRAPVVGIPAVLVYMSRGSNRGSLTTRTPLRYAEARRCIRLLYERYRNDPASPIDRRLYRRAMAAQRMQEARRFGRVRGLGLLALSLWHQPTNRKAWKTLREFGLHAAGRLGVARQPVPKRKTAR
jgi:glycosyltransferase involved in cell wall biosynthesis